MPQPTTALWYVYLSKNMWNYLGQNVFRLKNHPDHYLPKAVNLMSGLRHEMVTWKLKSCLIVIVQSQNVPLTWWPQSSFRGVQEQQLQGNIDRMRKLRYVFLFGNFWDHFYFSTSKLDLRSYFGQLEQSLSQLCFDFQLCASFHRIHCANIIFRIENEWSKRFRGE